MRAGTKYFGEVEYRSENVLRFSDGLFGFEEEKEFLFIPFNDDEACILFCLQSLKHETLAFTILDPFMLDPAYAPRLTPEELEKLGVEQNEDLLYYVLCAVKNPISASTVNMKCPIAINEHTKQSLQTILEDCPYTMRHALSEIVSRGRDGQC